jgi:hypothetical protein
VLQFHMLPCVFFLIVMRSMQMVKWHIVMSFVFMFMCTDKQHLLSMEFCLNVCEIGQIFVAGSFGFILLFTFYCSIVET